ncbi:MAG: hypothetical protein ABJA62_08140 [Luteimonas sp.]
MPVFASQLRKRPLALQNEGTASAFVNCSLMSTDRSVDGVDAVVVTADNNTAAPIDITCTLVTGLSKMGTPQFFPQTITMPPNSGGLTNEFVWSPTLNDGKPFDNFSINLSCNLPVGAGIGITTSQFDQGVGM